MQKNTLVNHVNQELENRFNMQGRKDIIDKTDKIDKADKADKADKKLTIYH